MSARKIATFSFYRAFKHLTGTLLSICIGEFLVIITLVCLLVGLFPLKEVQPMLLTIKEQGNQVVRIEPFARDTRGTDLLIEKLACRYVELRETFDNVSESHRLNELMLMTSFELWEAFRSLISNENKESPFRQFQENKVTRSVHIKNCLSLAPSAPDTYRIEWTSVDYRDGQEIDRKNWITTLAIKLEEKEVCFEDQYINPIGFTVISYAVAKKEL